MKKTSANKERKQHSSNSFSHKQSSKKYENSWPQNNPNMSPMEKQKQSPWFQTSLGKIKVSEGSKIYEIWEKQLQLQQVYNTINRKSQALS